jgi:hypothetical protein
MSWPESGPREKGFVVLFTNLFIHKGRDNSAAFVL